MTRNYTAAAWNDLTDDERKARIGYPTAANETAANAAWKEASKAAHKAAQSALAAALSNGTAGDITRTYTDALVAASESAPVKAEIE